MAQARSRYGRFYVQSGLANNKGHNKVAILIKTTATQKRILGIVTFWPPCGIALSHKHRGDILTAVYIRSFPFSFPLLP
jgi:hypothetical protein